jgi:hypothetical protein
LKSLVDMSCFNFSSLFNGFTRLLLFSPIFTYLYFRAFLAVY